MKFLTKREKTESQFLTITGILVALIGAPAFISVLKEPTIQKVNFVAQQDSDSSQRRPASLPNISGSEINVIKDIVVKLTCEGEISNQLVEASSVRLVGLPCEDVENVQIKNKTNGYTAAVIFTKGNQYTTDFIDLKDGENKIEIVSELDDGSKVTRNLKVNRRMPAQAKSE